MQEYGVLWKEMTMCEEDSAGMVNSVIINASESTRGNG